MATRTFGVAGYTTEAVADGANLTDNKYLGLKGGSSTQVTKIQEIQSGGIEASTSSPQKMILAFDSTVVVTPTALSTGESDTADVPCTAALAAPVVSFTAGSTKPQRAKAYLAVCPFNAIGGVMIKEFPYGREPRMIGNAALSAGASAGEVSLSCFTGTTAALVGSHIKYETI